MSLGMVTLTDWMKKLFGIEDPPVGFFPIYQDKSKLTVTTQGGTVQVLNQNDFLSEQSAHYLAGQYFATVTPHVPDVAGGIESVPEGLLQYYLNWIDIPTQTLYSLNSSILAHYYRWAIDPSTGNAGLPSVAPLSTIINQCHEMITKAKNDALVAAGKVTN